MAKYTNGQIYGEAYADAAQEQIMAKANAAKTYGERYELMNHEGKEIIAQHPLFFAWFNVKGWLACMIDPGRFEWVHFLNLSEGSYLGLYHVIHTQGLVNGIIEFISNAPLGLLLILLICLLSNVLISIALLSTLFNKQVPLILRICIFLFIGYILASTGVLGLSRYRIAFAPLLWISFIIFVEKYLSKKFHATN
jgi:hypothetical protein